MIREIARLRIDPAQAEAFLAAVADAAPLFRQARGCRSMRMEQLIEDPGIFLLLVEWETLDDHLVGFRHSPAFQQWRSLVGPFFLAPPVVEHSETQAIHF
jgi:quinol monooxygenase YgiN